MANPTALTLDGQAFRKNSDIIMAVALIGVLALMIVPLPAFQLPTGPRTKRSHRRCR